MRLAFSWSGTKRLTPCASLCIDFCRACKVCDAVTFERDESNDHRGFEKTLIEYCIPMLRIKQPPNQCTESRSCGWLNGYRMDPLKCPVLNT